MEELILDEKMIRVMDLLNQVKSLNKMIALHQEQSQDGFMIDQYQDRKNRFLIELKEILGDFEIEVMIKGEAA